MYLKCTGGLLIPQISLWLSSLLPIILEVCGKAGLCKCYSWLAEYTQDIRVTVISLAGKFCHPCFQTHQRF